LTCLRLVSPVNSFGRKCANCALMSAVGRKILQRVNFMVARKKLNCRQLRFQLSNFISFTKKQLSGLKQLRIADKKRVTSQLTELKWEVRNDDVFDRFKDFITHQLIRDWTKYDTNKAKEMLKPVRNMLENSEAFKINIFPLNYDLIFEEIFNSSTSKILDNGFSEKNISDAVHNGGCLFIDRGLFFLGCCRSYSKG